MSFIPLAPCPLRAGRTEEEAAATGVEPGRHQDCCPDRRPLARREQLRCALRGGASESHSSSNRLRQALSEAEELYSVYRGDGLITLEESSVPYVHEIDDEELNCWASRMADSRLGADTLDSFCQAVQDLKLDADELRQASVEGAGDALSGAIAGPRGLSVIDVQFRKVLMDSDCQDVAKLQKTRRDLLRYRERRCAVEKCREEEDESIVAILSRWMASGEAGCEVAFSHVVGRAVALYGCSETRGKALSLIAAARAGYKPDRGRWEAAAYGATFGGERRGVVIMDCLLCRASRMYFAPTVAVHGGALVQRLATGDLWLERRAWTVSGQSGVYEYGRLDTEVDGRVVKIQWNDEPLIGRLGEGIILDLARMLNREDPRVGRLRAELNGLAECCLPPEGLCVAKAYKRLLDEVRATNTELAELITLAVPLRTIAKIFSASVRSDSMSRGIVDRILAMAGRQTVVLECGETEVEVSSRSGTVQVALTGGTGADLTTEHARIISRVAKIMIERDGFKMGDTWSRYAVASTRLAPSYVPNKSRGSIHHEIWASKCLDILRDA